MNAKNETIPAKPAHADSLTLAVEYFSPERCQRELDTINVDNRPFVKANVRKVAAALREGKFGLNGETIIYDSQGMLADGQHRLRAATVAGTGFWSVVVRGVPRDLFPTLDGGKVRGCGDVLAMSGTSDGNTVAAAIRHVHKINSRFTSVAPIQKEDIQRLAKENPVDQHLDARSRFSELRRWITPSGVVAIHYLLSAIDRIQADAFMGSVNSGEGLFKGDPAYELRNRLVEESKDKVSRLREETIFALIVKAWNAFRQGKRVGVLKYTKSTESFPVIEA